ncbi:GGDEF domain-containing protein [Devosia aquimaris]|uniref:GGDEF domain-containing protein n=1 Tax=Devosia aquimaris TaxID=2866214 RepID=UPI001CD12A37|nr:GGDEF domain-containing protein [Devosia sp. CJK-A8-3]
MTAIDNPTLMLAIATSSAALMGTLIIAWFNARQDSYLVSWAIGMGFVVVALGAMSMRNGTYDNGLMTLAYSALLTGMTLIVRGSAQFRGARPRPRMMVAIWLLAVGAVAIPYLLGLSGLGTIMLNLACALFMLLSGYHFLAGRDESPVLMVTGAVLFALTGISFIACAGVLAASGQMVLYAAPSNWAEQFNSIMAIAGLSGLGAISLTLSQSRATRRHRREAHTDSLSGLLNRRAIFDRFGLDHLPLGTAVLMFDIDLFKQINDRCGHAAGDAVIAHFGGILARQVRPGDTVARLGGEEFCAVLPETPIEAARAIADEVRSQFEAHPARLLGEHIAATVSVGVATSGTAESFSSTLSRADSALYKAKHAGRNQVFSAPPRQIA